MLLLCHGRMKAHGQLGVESQPVELPVGSEGRSGLAQGFLAGSTAPGQSELLVGFHVEHDHGPAMAAFIAEHGEFSDLKDVLVFAHSSNDTTQVQTPTAWRPGCKAGVSAKAGGSGPGEERRVILDSPLSSPDKLTERKAQR